MVCDDNWTIAATSGGFTQDCTLIAGIYYVGDNNCGWSGCDYDLTTKVTSDVVDPIPKTDISIGITNPVGLKNGDFLELCGMAYISNNSATTFEYMLSYFDCSEDISTSEAFTQINIFVGTAPIIQNRVCFNYGFSILNSLLTRCNIHFIIGFNTQGALVNHSVKFTYNLHINRRCI